MSVSLVKSGEQQMVAHITNLYATAERLWKRSADLDGAGNHIGADLLTGQAMSLDRHACYLEGVLEVANGESAWAHA